MNRFETFLKKRSSLSLVALLKGVAFAGLITTIIHTPQSDAEYMHAHLHAASANSLMTWSPVDFDLSTSDKLKIERSIITSEGQSSAAVLKTTLTGQALEQALESKCALEDESCRLILRLNRQLTPQILNRDFRILNVKDQSFRVDLDAKAESSEVVLKGISQESRVLRFYKTQSGWMQNTSQTIETSPALLEDRKDKFVGRLNDKFLGLNYYPASASWVDFWKSFPIDEIKSDFKKLQDLNVNALRVFITHDYFDNMETRADALSKLLMFLDICEKNNIKVLITLFDLRPDYTLSNWAADIKHIDSILKNISSHNAILGVDLKNQPDLDFNSWGVGWVEAWLTTMAHYIRNKYPEIAITTGWSDSEHATRLAYLFDIITYHEYKNLQGLDSRLNKIISQVGGKPVMITEIGSTVWRPPYTKRFAEASQAERLQNQLSQTKTATGVFIWTLNDFEHVAKEVVGPLPWRQAQQRHYGLIRADDTVRPAAKVLQRHGENWLTHTVTAKIRNQENKHTQNSKL